jgi:fibronectin-binding autotransporter adhesin
VIYFDDKALTGFDSRLDALKLMNTDQMVPNLYAVSADGYNLSINALPPYADSLLVVPLGIKTARNGSITFRIRDTINLLPGTEIYLNDKETGVNRIMNQGTEYIIYLNAGEYNSRFSLRFIAAATGIPGNSTISDQLSLYSTRGIIIADINLPPGKRGFLLINNISGQILFRKEIYEGGYHEFNPKLKTGIYIVSFITGNVRYVKKIFIPGK